MNLTHAYFIFQLLGSNREFHFIHRSVPHARTRRSLSHMRTLKSHPDVSEFIIRIQKRKTHTCRAERRIAKAAPRRNLKTLNFQFQLPFFELQSNYSFYRAFMRASSVAELLLRKSTCLNHRPSVKLNFIIDSTTIGQVALPQIFHPDLVSALNRLHVLES